MTTLAALQTLPYAHDLFARVDELYREVREDGEKRYRTWAPAISRRAFVPSARNLAAYLALRERDLRRLQEDLVPLGLSSLGRSEAHVLPTLRAVRATLAALCGVVDAAADRPSLREFRLGEWLLRRNTRAIFGGSAGRAHIMVTLPSEAATDYDLVKDLVKTGMDCARINCAHDGPDTWRGIASNVRRAAAELQAACSVYVDVAGPKIRTLGPLTHDPKRRFVAGDRLVLAKEPPSAPAEPPRIACSEPAVFDALRPGAQVWINDGKIGATVVELQPDGALLEITRTGEKGNKIAADKGLNFPQSRIRIGALTEKDRTDLDAIVAIADVVGQSFVRDARDLAVLQQELDRRGKALPLIAKIETAEAIRNLPEILVQGGAKAPFGVMIARGDLAVEIGYKRLAEIQEELLWLCESAHVPVVWATQVLDQLVRKGVLSRAEITDAAMAERAECVMLNKGPFLHEAIATLSDVLVRMQGHQSKKMAMLRALRSWTGA